MCGIAGVLVGVGGEPATPAELAAMAAAIAHRGPDGTGLYVDDEVGLAGARLSIVDLEAGFQPLRNEDATLWLVANGEIFNHLELRAGLERRGHAFRTRSDCETILHAYEEWGLGALARLNGQFAFALWDGREGRLVLARDPIGILPLHVAHTGTALVFASECKAIFAGGRVRPRLDPSALPTLLVTWGLPAPRTAFAGVRAVRPGTALTVDRDLSLAETRYWSLGGAEGGPERLDEAASAIGDALAASVALRLRADVEVASYLSGGLDSAIVTSLASRAQPGLRTFGIGFADPVLDETREQRAVAAALGTEHLSVAWSMDEAADALGRVVRHCETPLLRLSPLPLAVLARHTRAAGLKVVLSGEGADELLGGYDLYKEARFRRFLARDPASPVRGALAARLHAETAARPGRAGEQWLQFFARGLDEVDDPFFSHRIRWLNSAWSLRLLADGVRAEVDVDRIAAEVEESLPVGWRTWSPFRRAQLLEVETFLSSYLLSCQGDRVAMASGLEVRYPFLDPGLVELAFALPDRAKMIGLRDKVALRRAAARLLPPELARRPKHAYRAPAIGTLLASSPVLDDLLDRDALRETEAFDPESVVRLADRVRARGAQAGVREQQALTAVVTTELLRRELADAPPRRAASGPPVLFEDRRSPAGSRRAGRRPRAAA